jgi:hypothetical protein
MMLGLQRFRGWRRLMARKRNYEHLSIVGDQKPAGGGDARGWAVGASGRVEPKGREG